MADSFDPYEKWLKIPKTRRPLNCYVLLGLKLFESDAERIEKSARKRIAYVEQFQTGSYAKMAGKVLEQLKKAQKCLLDPRKKAKYDKKLSEEQAASGGEPKRSSPGTRKKKKSSQPAAPPMPAPAAEPEVPSFDFAAASAAPSKSSDGGSYVPPQKKKNPWIIPAALGGVLFLIFAVGLSYIMLNEEPDADDLAMQADRDKAKAEADAAAEKERDGAEFDNAAAG
ncbi:MAG: hypothetical protein N2C14_12685, partial [Planctomycetales bacterium]